MAGLGPGEYSGNGTHFRQGLGRVRGPLAAAEDGPAGDFDPLNQVDGRRLGKILREAGGFVDQVAVMALGVGRQARKDALVGVPFGDGLFFSRRQNVLSRQKKTNGKAKKDTPEKPQGRTPVGKRTLVPGGPPCGSAPASRTRG